MSLENEVPLKRKWNLFRAQFTVFSGLVSTIIDGVLSRGCLKYLILIEFQLLVLVLLMASSLSFRMRNFESRLFLKGVFCECKGPLFVMLKNWSLWVLFLPSMKAKKCVLHVQCTTAQIESTRLTQAWPQKGASLLTRMSGKWTRKGGRRGLNVQVCPREEQRCTTFPLRPPGHAPGAGCNLTIPESSNAVGAYPLWEVLRPQCPQVSQADITQYGVPGGIGWPLFDPVTQSQGLEKDFPTAAGSHWSAPADLSCTCSTRDTWARATHLAEADGGGWVEVTAQSEARKKPSEPCVAVGTGTLRSESARLKRAQSSPTPPPRRPERGDSPPTQKGSQGVRWAGGGGGGGAVSLS
jgi:hypothetical protein